MSQTPKTKKRIKHSDDSAEGKAQLHPGLHRIDVQQVLQDEGVRAELARRLPELKASPAFAIIRAKPAPTKPADFADAAGCGAYVESKPSAELAGKLDADEEKIIRVTGRPSLLISHGTFQRPELRTIAALLEPHRQRIETAIRSVGRVEMNLDEIGTAWMVAEGIAITNSHVASVFAGRSGDGFAFRNIGNKPARVAVDFFEEFNNRDTMEFLVQSVLYIADAGEPDIALLKLQKDPSRRFPPPLHLHPMKSALKTRTAIAAIGYPANDPNEDPNLIRSYFGSTFDVKRLSPGEIMTHDKAHGFFTHDCSTLGGNSGSAIIELTTGAVVGLHYAGRSLKANFAVDSATIKKVVTPILSGHRVSLPLQPPPVVRPESAEEERKVSVEDFEGRDGYQEEFLGRQFKLTTPTVSGAAASKVLTFWHFSLQVHKVRKQPWWTAVNINGNELPARNPKRVPTSGWVKDPRLDAKYQIGADFYTKSGFTRGHLVRRLDPVWGEEYEAANIDTFTYANACPQDLDFNGNFWGDLEDEVLTDAHGQKMTVFTGPIFKNTDPTYTNNGVSVVVPYNFFKIPAFVRNGKIVASAYVLSQQSYLEGRDPASWRTYQVPIADVEKQTGINFGKLKQFDTFNVLESANPTGRRLIQSLDDLHPHLFGEASTSDESAVADVDDESVAADADDE